ncbi:unnamed protein product [Closterium sp. NIES-64]|nr:unnamed protein product [Closterium sp. NIES-64]
MYNDHHFHYGYFIYAAATVAKFDSAWRDQYRAPLKDLMVDYIGLFEFVDGRNQESFCEAANAYYAAALLASVLGNQPLATLGATLAAVEALAGQTLMHVPLASSYPHPSLSPGYNVFAPPADMEKRVGIQVLPVSPFLTHLFPDHEFAKQLVEWAQPVLTRATTHEWRNFAWALQAFSGCTSPCLPHYVHHNCLAYHFQHPSPCPHVLLSFPSLQPSFPLSPTSPPRWRMAIGGNKEALQSLQ